MAVVAEHHVDSQIHLTMVPDLASGRRKHKRVSITLLGRFMRSNKQEYPCRLVNISVGGISVMSPVELEEGEFIVAYFDKIGSVQGHVARLFDGGFGLRLKISKHKREKLAAELTWLINKDSFASIDARRDKRLTVCDRYSVLSLGDGFETKCKILDISLTGASVEVAARPSLGAVVQLGKQRAIVRRHHENGIGLQFVMANEPDQSEQNEL